MTKLTHPKILLAFAALFFSLLTLWSKLSLMSDSLFAEELAIDLWNRGGSWADWRFSPAPAYFPDIIFYLIFFPLLPDAWSRIFATDVVQILLITCASLWTARKSYLKISPTAHVLIIFLVIYSVLLTSQGGGLLLYFHSTNNHFSALLIPIVMIGLVIRLYETGEHSWSIIIIILNIAGYLSSKLYVISFLAPSILLCILLLLPFETIRNRWTYNRDRIFYIFSMLSTSWVISIVVEPLVLLNNPLANRVPFTSDAAIKSFTFIVESIYQYLVFNNPWVTTLFSIFILSTYLIIKYTPALIRDSKCYLDQPTAEDREDGKLLLCILFTALCSVASLAGIIISGIVWDTGWYRYYLLPISLVIGYSIILLDKALKLRSPRFTIVIYLSCICVGLISLVDYIKFSSTSYRDQALPVTGCITKAQLGGFNLREGISDYWNGRWVSEFLPQHNYILQMTEAFEPEFWMSTIGPVRRPLRYGYFYNFVILGESRKNMADKLPQPNLVLDCEGTSSKVWLYEDARLDNAVKATFNPYVKKLGLKSE